MFNLNICQLQHCLKKEKKVSNIKIQEIKYTVKFNHIKMMINNLHINLFVIKKTNISNKKNKEWQIVKLNSIKMIQSNLKIKIFKQYKKNKILTVH
jgi:hypothetical protein